MSVDWKWIAKVRGKQSPTPVAQPTAQKAQPIASMHSGTASVTTFRSSFLPPTAGTLLLDGNLRVTVATNRGWRDAQYMDGFDVSITLSVNGLTLHHYFVTADELITMEAKARLAQGEEK